MKGRNGRDGLGLLLGYVPSDHLAGVHPRASLGVPFLLTYFHPFL